MDAPIVPLAQYVKDRDEWEKAKIISQQNAANAFEFLTQDSAPLKWLERQGMPLQSWQKKEIQQMRNKAYGCTKCKTNWFGGPLIPETCPVCGHKGIEEATPATQNTQSRGIDIYYHPPISEQGRYDGHWDSEPMGATQKGLLIDVKPIPKVQPPPEFTYEKCGHWNGEDMYRRVPVKSDRPTTPL